jgi:hypothetical protein
MSEREQYSDRVEALLEPGRAMLHDGAENSRPASLEMVEGGLYRNAVGAELCLIGPAYRNDEVRAVFKTLAPGLWVAKVRTDWGSGMWLVTAEGMAECGYSRVTKEPTE